MYLGFSPFSDLEQVVRIAWHTGKQCNIAKNNRAGIRPGCGNMGQCDTFIFTCNTHLRSTASNQHQHLAQSELNRVQTQPVRAAHTPKRFSVLK